MLSPSKLSGSIRSSSSSGKTPSESKHSGTADNTLLMSLDRLGLESSEREQNREWIQEMWKNRCAKRCFFQLVTWKASPLISLMESLSSLTDFGLAWPQSDAFLLGHLHKTHSYVGTKYWGVKTLFLTPHTIKTETVVSVYSKQMQWDTIFFHMYTTKDKDNKEMYIVTK